MDKVIRELINLPTTVYCGFYQLRITHDLRDETVKLLKEQEDSIKILVADLDDLRKEHERLLDKKIPLITQGKEVVRCKDCIHMKVMPCDIHGHIPIYCTNLGIYSEGLDWFCADGIAKDTDVPNK